MAYLGLSPDHSEYPNLLAELESNCDKYCAWSEATKAGRLAMDYMERPPGCTCPGELPMVGEEALAAAEAERIRNIAQKQAAAAVAAELPMTPQQIEAQVKREQVVSQPAQAGGALVLAALAALVLFG